MGRTVPVIEIRGLAAWDGDIRPGLDGQLVLTANDARMNGMKLRQIFGRDFIENWSDPAEWLSWEKAHLLDAGEYEVSINGGGVRADVPYRLQIGEKELTGKAPSAAAWNKGVVIPVGKITIEKAGVYPVALRFGSIRFTDPRDFRKSPGKGFFGSSGCSCGRQWGLVLSDLFGKRQLDRRTPNRVASHHHKSGIPVDRQGP